MNRRDLDTLQVPPGTFKALQEMAAGIAEFGQAVFSSLSTVIEQVTPVLQEFYAACRQKYHEAGSPYGDTDEGMRRWFRELGEVQRLRQEADMILAHHQMLVDLRKFVQKRTDEQT